MQYANDIILMDHSRTGLQRLMSGLHEFNTENKLYANREKTKVMIFQRCPNKSKLRWNLGDLTIRTARAYNYLGVWFMKTQNLLGT